MLKLLLELESEGGPLVRPVLWDTVPRIGELFPIPLDNEFDNLFGVRIVAHYPGDGYITINLGNAEPEYTAAILLTYGWVKIHSVEYEWVMLPFQRSCTQIS